LLCPSDPSVDNGATRSGQVENPPWGSTNYLANWNAFGDSTGDGSSVSGPWSTTGYLSPAQSFTDLKDGMAYTILFGEGYAYCDTYGRRALYSWTKHNFGITESLKPGQLDPTANEPPLDYPNGMPNTFMFQVKPLPLDHRKCPPGRDCCD